LENYQICFSDAVYACKQFLKNKLTSSQLKTYIEKHLSIIRPGRTFKRRLRTQSVVSFTYRVS
ncbi:IS4 family transposase, partial [Streptococcus sp. 10F2]